MWVVLLLVLAAGGCTSREKPAPKDGKLQVIATIFPVYDFARTVGGEKAEVHLLLPPGVEPHNYEPKPEEAIRISRADLFVYTDIYMEPWAATMLKGLDGGRKPVAVEAGKGAAFLPGRPHDDHGDGHDHDRTSFDPHIWLDPVNARLMTENIAAAMIARDPVNGAYYRANADRYLGELARLDEQFRTGLATCSQRAFLHGGHYAFAYLAKRYGLTYLSAYGVSAEAEPTPGRMVELIKQMKSRGLTTIFYEELLSPAIAETIAKETGANLLRLHGVHNVTKDDLARGVSYLSLMEENLRNLRSGLKCP